MKPQKTLIILSDEHQARSLGCANHPFVKTPNLDILAKRGTRFTNAITPSPICVPARASFATGQYVHKIGYWDNSFGYDGRVTGWGHELQKAEIPVHSIGKLHYQKEDLPTGFDKEHIPMHLHQGIGMVWASIRDPLPAKPPSDKRMLGEHIGAGESDYTRYDAAITDLACEWLRNEGNKSETWCLYVGLVAPHFPLTAPQKFYDLYNFPLPEPKLSPRSGYQLHPWVKEHEDFWSHDAVFKDDVERKAAQQAYYGLTSWLDFNVGRLMTALEENGLFATTRVIYASDHGDNVGARGLWGKSNLYRESVDVPLIIAGEGVPIGECNTPVSLIDISQTILESCGVKPLANSDGRSLLKIANEQDDLNRVTFSEYHAVGSNSGGFMLRKGRFKYHYYVGHAPELFDLENDPEELNNLSENPHYKNICDALKQELYKVCSPELIDKQAKIDQKALITRFGGNEAALKLGSKVKGGTPPPKVKEETQ